MTRVNVKHFLLLTLVWTLSGCMGVSEYLISAPLRSEAYDATSGGIVKIGTPEVVIYLRPANSQMLRDGLLFTFPLPPIKAGMTKQDFIDETDYYPDPDTWRNRDLLKYFFIEILLNAKRKEFSFNPKETSLILENGTKIPTSAYINVPAPLKIPGRVQTYLFSSNVPLDKETTLDTFYDISPKAPNGFAVKFDVPPPYPGTRFSVEIRGLQYRGNNLKPLIVDFVDAKKVDSVYQ